MPAKPLQELAFVCGVITALSIIYLSHLPCHLCTLSFLYHLNYGKDKVLTSTILCSHHPQLANAIEEFMVGGLWAPISSLTISYLDIDVSTWFFFFHLPSILIHLYYRRLMQLPWSTPMRTKLSFHRSYFLPVCKDQFTMKGISRKQHSELGWTSPVQMDSSLVR